VRTPNQTARRRAEALLRLVRRRAENPLVYEAGHAHYDHRTRYPSRRLLAAYDDATAAILGSHAALMDAYDLSDPDGDKTSTAARAIGAGLTPQQAKAITETIYSLASVLDGYARHGAQTWPRPYVCPHEAPAIWSAVAHAIQQATMLPLKWKRAVHSSASYDVDTLTFLPWATPSALCADHCPARAGERPAHESGS